MEDFTVVSRLTTKSYIKSAFILISKKWQYYLILLCGLFLVGKVVLNHFHVIDYPSSTPYFDLTLGLFFLLWPILVLIILLRQLRSNPALLRENTYTFSENGIMVQGTGHKGEFDWTHIIRYREAGRFIVLYHSKTTGNFIDKTKMTPEQLAFIKSKVKKK